MAAKVRETWEEKMDREALRRQALKESLKLIYERQLNYEQLQKDHRKKHSVQCDTRERFSGSRGRL